MTQFDVAHNRKIAAMLADTLAPLVAEHLEAAPQRPPVTVMALPDIKLINAVARVAKSLDRFDQAKFAGSEEGPARRELDRAVRALQTEWRTRQKNRLPFPNQEPTK